MGALGQHVEAVGKAFVEEILAVYQFEITQGVERGEPAVLVFLQAHIFDTEAVDVEIEHLGDAYVLEFLQFETFAEVEFEDVAHAQTGTGYLVGVGRTDAFQRGAYFFVAFGLFVGGVEQTVCGQYQVRFLGDEQVFGGIHIFLPQSFNLAFEYNGVYQHSVAYDVFLVGMENSRGYYVQHVFYSVELEGVSGVGAALKTCNNIVVWRKHVNHFSFSFVAPLQAQQYINFTHKCLFVLSA